MEFLCTECNNLPSTTTSQKKTKYTLRGFSLQVNYTNNIKMDLREIGWDGVDWMDMVQDRDQWRTLVNTVLNLWVP
jgi:hypothetical protein